MMERPCRGADRELHGRVSQDPWTAQSPGGHGDAGHLSVLSLAQILLEVVPRDLGSAERCSSTCREAPTPTRHDTMEGEIGNMQ